METTVEQITPVFNTCGIDIFFEGVPMVDHISVSHKVPESLDDIAKHREDRSTTDIEINIGGKTIFGHRNFLSSRIPYFKSLFDSEMIECDGKIKLSNTFCEFGLIEIENLVEYAYTGQLTISTTNVQDLIICAQYLRMDSVMKECAEFMRRLLTIDNILSIFSLCKTIGCHEIDYHLLNFIDVFEAVNRWIENDPNRKHYAERLLKCVRLTRISISYIMENIETSEWVMENSGCIALIDKAKEWIVSQNVQKESLPFKITKRVCEHAHALFISYKCPYSDEDSPDDYLHLYDPLTNRWTKLNNEGMHHGQNVLTYIIKNKFYLCRPISLENNWDDWEVMQIYDTTSNEWHTDKNKITQNTLVSSGWPPRTAGTSAFEEIDGRVYVVGGHAEDDASAISDLITYDEISKDWIFLSPMMNPRASPLSAVLNGKLYVMGGQMDYEDDTEALRCAERYDPELNSWSPICPMKYPRTGGAAVAFNGQIYVIGGAAEANFNRAHSEVERYDPLSDTWTSLKSMKTKRLYHSAHLSCGKIFVFGGHLSWKVQTNSVEMYDPVTDTWEDREPMTSKFSFCNSLSVPAHLPSPVPNLEGVFINGFHAFNLKEELLKAVKENGIEQSNRAQSECIRQSITGNDILCQADSGAGKAALLVIATLQQLDILDGELSTLVLCFSRENVYKIREYYERFSKYMAIKTEISLGGMSSDKDREVFEKARPHIVIGTALRIKNIIQSGSLKMDKFKRLAIYDGDRILGERDGRFSTWKIMDSMPKAKQIMLFSRTRTEQLQNFCKNRMRKTPHCYIFHDE